LPIFCKNPIRLADFDKKLVTLQSKIATSSLQGIMNKLILLLLRTSVASESLRHSNKKRYETVYEQYYPISVLHYHGGEGMSRILAWSMANT